MQQKVTGENGNENGVEEADEKKWPRRTRKTGKHIIFHSQLRYCGLWLTSSLSSSSTLS